MLPSYGKPRREPNRAAGSAILQELMRWLPDKRNNGVPKGIRTPVAAVKGRSPRPLDDGDVGLDQSNRGGARRDRTADLLHAMQALSQLSYSPTESRTLRTKACRVKSALNAI
jgi:hypothetical protein